MAAGVCADCVAAAVTLFFKDANIPPEAGCPKKVENKHQGFINSSTSSRVRAVFLGFECVCVCLCVCECVSVCVCVSVCLCVCE